MSETTAAIQSTTTKAIQGAVFPILLAVSFGHTVNDIMQSLLAALYPLLKDNYRLDFWQIGLLTFAFQVTASLLQPAIGYATDKRPMPYSLPLGMLSSLFGLILLAYAATIGCCSPARC